MSNADIHIKKCVNDVFQNLDVYAPEIVDLIGEYSKPVKSIKLINPEKTFGHPPPFETTFFIPEPSRHGDYMVRTSFIINFGSRGQIFTKSTKNK